MSSKPTMITQDQVAELLEAMKPQRDQLASAVEQLEHRVHQIENSLKENEQLKAQVKELIHLSTTHFYTEWKRKSDFFPEIRFSILQKTVDLVAAPKK